MPGIVRYTQTQLDSRKGYPQGHKASPLRLQGFGAEQHGGVGVSGGDRAHVPRPLSGGGLAERWPAALQCGRSRRAPVCRLSPNGVVLLVLQVAGRSITSWSNQSAIARPDLISKSSTQDTEMICFVTNVQTPPNRKMEITLFSFRLLGSVGFKWTNNCVRRARAV